MRLLRVGAAGRERPCAVGVDGSVRDLSTWVDDWTGPALAVEAMQAISRRFTLEWAQLPQVHIERERIGPALRPGQILSIGLNYHRHAREAGMTLPEEPIVSSKSVHALGGPFDDLVLPLDGDKTDWEVELGVVIGRRVQYLATPADAAACILGYCTANDLSERSWLLERGGQWIKGKSFDGFAPLGPYLVTADEVPSPQALELICRVNGEVMQHDSSEDMIFDVYHLIHYLSRFMTLHPGDVILTGSPGGMALGRPDQPFLRSGDVVEAEVVGLGAQRQVCRAFHKELT
ncbi:fumarylacetoacetate hydrolase family protein [Pseudomonas sp. SIMBA_059]|uniref:fumarylacetoacetate hydrolase family protein n=2 Tax=Bacteria TaxID=2 RepID=UPI0018E67570|nr:fumarylacetoacetate hydrolase family protein [Pseudomonas palleroniana]MBI6910351.1 fumarylacetoacetate hydrolase family protein [Pseudomonas palleroniana]